MQLAFRFDNSAVNILYKYNISHIIRSKNVAFPCLLANTLQNSLPAHKTQTVPLDCTQDLELTNEIGQICIYHKRFIVHLSNTLFTNPIRRNAVIKDNCHLTNGIMHNAIPRPITYHYLPLTYVNTNISSPIIFVQ